MFFSDLVGSFQQHWTPLTPFIKKKKKKRYLTLIFVCSGFSEESNAYVFETTWEEVNDDSIHSGVKSSFKHALGEKN